MKHFKDCKVGRRMADTNYSTSTRRQFLTAVAGLAAAETMGSPGGLAQQAPAKTFTLGEFAITVLSDGHLVVPSPFLARNASPEDLNAAMRDAGQRGDRVNTPTNITLVRTQSEVILIDTGSGPHYMPTAGSLAENMAAAGIDRNSVTKVVFTHAHPDHLWGTFDDFDNEPMFPNASYVISAAEWNFWMAEDVASRLPVERQNFAPGAKRNLNAIKDKVWMIKPGDDIVTGVRAIDTSGHTPGHLSIEIASGRDAVIVLADALTHAIISFAHPEWMPAADHHDPEGAVVTRKTLLDRLATDRNRVIGFHLPFPGIGVVERRGIAYRFVPTG
jgi:glyoxylase-like metal-dependent hydrolase (beta-lactamase superfamily II)